MFTDFEHVKQLVRKLQPWAVKTTLLAAVGIFSSSGLNQAQAQSADSEIEPTPGLYADDEAEQRCPIYPCCDPAICHP